MSEVSPESSPRQRPRLLWTLLGAMVLVGVLPLIVSHVFLIGMNRDSLETLEMKYLTRSAVTIATDVNNLLTNNTQQLTKVAASIRTMRAALPAGSDPYVYAAQANIITDYLTPDGDLLALRILNRAGQGAEAKPPQMDASIGQELTLAVQAASTGQPYVGTFQYLTATQQPCVVIAVPVVDGNQVTGVVEGLVSLRRITDVIRDEGKRMDVTAFLVDRNGKALIHSEPAIDVRRPDMSNLKIVQEFEKAPVRLTRSYEETIDGKKVTMLGTVAPVGRPDWGVVVEKPQAQAFASVNKMVKATIEWVSIALLLAIVVAVAFASGIARPIRALAERTREIAAGNFQQRVDVRANNEIGELGENFNLMSGAIEQAIEQLKKAAHENNLLFINSVRMLAAAIDAKDPYTRGHSDRVARYSVAIGKNLGLPEKEMRNLRISALLHDVGKIGIDDRILRKPGALSDDEFEVMKGHPAKGAAIMGGVAQLIDIIPGMKYHHEKWSGGGYPESLEGEQIPMQARIVAIADTFDAMTTNRPYQKAMELNYVVDKIKSFATTRFDPRVVDAFVNAVKRGDIQIEEQVRGAA
jgi:HD-GYP domain-containing protein (c-di-GMP phosphodiesterase class II)